MLHRHPFLSLLTLLYLGFVGLVTLTPAEDQPDYSSLAARLLARLERYPDLDALTSRLSVDRVEFLANIGLFVPLGVFLLLLVGSRLWWVALAAGIVLTSMIENVQRQIPGRVSDPRDVAANSIGMFLGILLALVLTLPATLRRRRQREREQREQSMHV
ncbi:VanZ family protein [Nocardioides renjunii]|uniref:VanZ family protein n=1 Tax=Nocardioides renjunii TaxID=3095075 RepID=UPI002AFFAC8B|nr:VanZ family protein [Nocardioides sp. S-34]WQQ20558.1 VanZ family protein [Nocardioides sp. S-34]